MQEVDGRFLVALRRFLRWSSSSPQLVAYTKKLSRRSKLPGSWKLGAYTLVSWEPELPTNAG